MTTTSTKAEILSTRRTADGYTVGLWSDGCVTSGYLHQCVKGSGVARTAEAVAANVRAGWLLLGEVELYDRAELPTMLRAARRAVAAAEPIPAFRAMMNPTPTPKPAKPHSRGCRCPQCVREHVRAGCRSVHCRTCGF